MEVFRKELERQGAAVDNRDLEAVVVGFDSGVTYDDIATATTFVHNRDLPLVATSGDPSYPSSDGLAPETGAILRAIEAATATEGHGRGQAQPPLVRARA